MLYRVPQQSHYALPAQAGLRRMRTLAAFLAITMAATLLGGPSASAATGSALLANSPTKSAGLSVAEKKFLKAALIAGAKPSKWQPGGPPLKAGKLKGKKVFVLSDSTNQFEQSFDTGVENAAKSVGMTVKRGDGNGVPTEDDQVIENAIDAHVNAIVLDAVPADTVGKSLELAKKAHIPVIWAFTGDPALPSAEDRAIGVTAYDTYCYSCTAKLVAYYELLRTNGNIHADLQEAGDSPQSEAIVKGWKQTMAKYCPKTCTTSYDVIQGANSTQETQNAAQVAAQNPQTNLLFPVFDYSIAYELPAVTAANASTRIDIDSENADLAQMQSLSQGTSVKVDVGNPVEWDGWAAMDQVLRALLHMAPSGNEKVPVRLFDTQNIKSVNLKKDPSTWYGNDNYAAAYEKLWGVKG